MDFVSIFSPLEFSAGDFFFFSTGSSIIFRESEHIFIIFSYIFHFFGGHLGSNPPGFLSQALLSIPLGSHILAPLGFLAPKLVTRLLKLHGHEKLSGEARKADLG